jgi:hypothetical protein
MVKGDQDGGGGCRGRPDGREKGQRGPALAGGETLGLAQPVMNPTMPLMHSPMPMVMANRPSPPPMVAGPTPVDRFASVSVRVTRGGSER